jgi:exodeoxyribonuclease VII small subunit
MCAVGLSGRWVLLGHSTPKIAPETICIVVMPKAKPLSPSESPASTAPSSYEDAMVELEQLVGRLESGELPLEQMLSGYQRGAMLLQFCREKLQAVEDQIKVLDNGALKTWKAQ